MKTSPRLRSLLTAALIGTTGLIILSCSTIPHGSDLNPIIVKGSPPVAFDQGGVLVPRTLKLSEKDLHRLNHVLEKFDKSLYEVRYYNHGKPTGDLVGMSRCVSPSEIGIIDAAAAKSGASNVAIQASVRINKPGFGREKSPWGGGGPTCSSASVNAVRAEQFSERITSILKKYSNP